MNSRPTRAPFSPTILRHLGRAATLLAHLLFAALLIAMLAFGGPEPDSDIAGAGPDASASVDFDAHSDGRP